MSSINKAKSAKRIKVKSYPGVYCRESSHRKYNGRPDKCYEFTFTNPATNKAGRQKVGWASEGYSAKDASEKRAEHIQKLRHGQTLSEGRKSEVTFGAAFSLYIDHHAKNNKKSFKDDVSLYEHHLKERFEHTLLSQIKPSHLERIKSELKWPTNDPEGRVKLKRKYQEKNKPVPWKSDSTINHIIGCVSRVYNKMILWPNLSGYMGANPVKAVKKLSQARSRQRFLNKEESDALLNELAARSLQTHNLAKLSLGTGMRRGELFNLRWIDIDLTSGIINIPVAKGGKDQKVHLPPQLIEMLKDMATTDSKGYVFTDRNGNKLKDISNVFKRVVDELGLNADVIEHQDKVVWHTLRHTYASWLAQSGKVTLVQLREIMRHKNIETTMQYIHLLPNADGKAAASIVGDILS